MEEVEGEKALYRGVSGGSLSAAKSGGEKTAVGLARQKPVNHASNGVCNTHVRSNCTF